jgi:hypothetical protein
VNRKAGNKKDPRFCLVRNLQIPLRKKYSEKKLQKKQEKQGQDFVFIQLVPSLQRRTQAKRFLKKQEKTEAKILSWY